MAETEPAGRPPTLEALAREFKAERQTNATARRKLTWIVYAMATLLTILGGVSVFQQFKNGDLADENAKAIAAIQTNRVQITYETCDRQNQRLAKALRKLRTAQNDPQAKALAKVVAQALGLTDEQYSAFVAANLKSTTELVGTIVLDEPIVQTPAGPRRDCEQSIVDRFGKAARLADLPAGARKRVDGLLRGSSPST